MALGAGRARVEDRVDPGVGLVLQKKVGDAVSAGDALCLVHHGTRGEPVEQVARRVLAAYRIGEERLAPGPLLLGEIA
jgi:pyrimidine-nucleoside phosphorylase/thymidine phosphorylase